MNYPEKAQAILSDAESYYFSAQTLSQRLGEDHGRSTAMLELLAFELALKAAFVLDRKKDAPTNHDYYAIWGELNSSTRELFLETAGTEVGPIEGTNELRYEPSRLARKLKRLEDAFKNGRYSYSKNLDRSKHQIREVERNWIVTGRPDEDADFEFGGEDLYGLYKALIGWCSAGIEH